MRRTFPLESAWPHSKVSTMLLSITASKRLVHSSSRCKTSITRQSCSGNCACCLRITTVDRSTLIIFVHPSAYLLSRSFIH